MNFLRETVKENASVDDKNFVLSLPTQKYFLLSEPTFFRLKMDLERFLVICSVMHESGDCRSRFRWHLESSRPCYQATFSNMDYGEFYVIEGCHIKHRKIHQVMKKIALWKSTCHLRNIRDLTQNDLRIEINNPSCYEIKSRRISSRLLFLS